MDTKGILKLLTNPVVLAGAVGGGTWYARKKKLDWVTAVAALGGGVAGMLIQKQFGPPAPTPAQIAAAQAAAQQGQGYGDYVDWQTGPSAEHSRHQPISRSAQVEAEASAVAQEVAEGEAGSLTGADGLGSYGGGFADDAALDEVMDELKRNGGAN